MSFNSQSGKLNTTNTDGSSKNTANNNAQELTKNNPNQIQEKQEKNAYKKYIVKEDDSLIGLSLKLNIAEKSIKVINEFSGDTIFPGMVINLPGHCDLSVLQQQSQKKYQYRPKISQLFEGLDKKKKVSKYDVYFYCNKQNIRGLLTLNNSMIMFNPDAESSENKKLIASQKILKYQLIAQFQDIKQILTMNIVQKAQNNKLQQNYHIIQFLLYRVGNKKLQQKYKERLHQLKTDKKPIGSVSFKIIANTQKEILIITNDIKKQADQFLRKESQIIKTQKMKQKSLTNVTHFDILNSNIVVRQDSTTLKEQELTQNIKEISIKMIDQSMLPHQAFVQIAIHFPLIYQLYNWTKLYDCLKHGTSFNTMIRNCKHQDPLLLIIKQYNGNLFGAFIIQQLEFGRTGTGEMFIWNYSFETKKVSVYKWTKKNEMFVLIDSSGLAIGMGDKYGIYVDSNLQKGFSSATLTFGNNTPLSLKQDFAIENIQIWGLETSS